MILITGGAWQGKYTYAVNLEKNMRIAGNNGVLQKEKITGAAETAKMAKAATVAETAKMAKAATAAETATLNSAKTAELLPAPASPQTADGLVDPFEAAYRSAIIRGFHNYVRRLLRDGKSVDQFIDRILQQNPDVIVTSDEVGCGIVPVSAEERAWREAAGRAQARLAANSSHVYRLVCAVPQQLK